MVVYFLIVAIFKAYNSGRKLLRNHFIFLVAFVITHSPPYYLYLFLTSKEEMEGINMVLHIQAGLIVMSSAGTILTLARIANKKLLNEIYYNIFKSKYSHDYIEYKLRDSSIKSIRMPLATPMIGDSVNFMSTSLYYDDLYNNTTFIVINI